MLGCIRVKQKNPIGGSSREKLVNAVLCYKPPTYKGLRCLMSGRVFKKSDIETLTCYQLNTYDATKGEKVSHSHFLTMAKKKILFRCTIGNQQGEEHENQQGIGPGTLFDGRSVHRLE